MSEVVSSSDFQSKVLDAQGPVLVDFFATWCGPCKMLAPTLDEVAAETAGKAAVYKLDIDQSPDIAQKYGVMSVPTLMVFENGQVKNQAVGVQPKQNILSMIGMPDVARAYRSSAGSRGVSPTTQARWQSQRPVSSDAVRR